jgi:hypothetical protein
MIEIIVLALAVVFLIKYGIESLYIFLRKNTRLFDKKEVLDSPYGKYLDILKKNYYRERMIQKQ